VRDVARFIRHNPRDAYPTWLILLVHLWSVLHDRPTSWACRIRHWAARTCPASVLPDQSTMSRRMRRDDFEPLLARVVQRLAGRIPADQLNLLKLFDGKALELPNHSRDPDARWGRGVSRVSKGCKLHAICTPGRPLPHAFVITPLDRCEKQMCPRVKPETGLGHRYQSPDRLRAIAMLEPPANLNDFGQSLYRCRTAIEREFAGITGFGGGLMSLPPWVRRIGRVRRWVIGKLLINAARIRLHQRTKRTA
jgi:hypothetical protein